MRPPSRIETILDLLHAIWDHQPDMRFLQLVYVLQAKYCEERHPLGIIRTAPEENGSQRTGYDLFNVEDDEFYQFLQDFLKELKAADG